MTEQSTLPTLLLLVRLNTDHPRSRVVGQLRTRMPKYPCPHISVNDVSAFKLNGISRKYRRIAKSNEI